MPELLRRFRYPLTYLLLACLCVIRLAASPVASDLSLPGRFILELTVPVERMVTLPVSFFRRAWGGYVALTGIREEKRLLEERLSVLEQENIEFREALVASERFRRLDQLQKRNELETVPANVIAQDLSPWFRSVVIDKGSGDGLRTGMPVLAAAGVAGVIAGTTPRASRVLLLTDPQSRVDVYVQRTRTRGTVQGRSAEICGFEYVLRDEDLEPGDVLLTSGLDRIYPKGLLVGRVKDLRRKPYGLFLEAEVKPTVDFGRLEEVFVIVDHPQVPPPEAFETDAGRLFSDLSGP